jgi:HlyD family secretion protein
VTFTVDAWPEKTFTGEVAQVRNSPIVTQNVVTYNVVVRVDNRELFLKPGMTANVSIEVKKYRDVLKIPNAALRYRPTAKGTESESAGKRQGNGKRKEAGGQSVHLPGKDGKPVPVRVKTGVSDGTFTVLEEGNLKEGDLLVTGESQGKKAGGSATPPGMGMGGFR